LLLKKKFIALNCLSNIAFYLCKSFFFLFDTIVCVVVNIVVFNIVEILIYNIVDTLIENTNSTIVNNATNNAINYIIK